MTLEISWPRDWCNRFKDLRASTHDSVLSLINRSGEGGGVWSSAHTSCIVDGLDDDGWEKEGKKRWVEEAASEEGKWKVSPAVQCVVCAPSPHRGLHITRQEIKSGQRACGSEGYRRLHNATWLKAQWQATFPFLNMRTVPSDVA